MLSSRLLPAFLACVLILGANFAPPPAYGQQRAEEDVVYLENGTVVRGTIVEQVPGEQITIRTRDGSQFVYSLGEVSRITKEPMFGQYASSSTQQTGYKEPSTATLLGVLCAGCGHLWSGDTKRGMILLGIGIGAPTVGAIITTSSCSGFGGGCSGTPVLLGVVAALGAWGYGIYDAGESADRMNTARGLALQPVVRPADKSFGLRLSFSAPLPRDRQ